MTAAPKKILIIDDEAINLEFFDLMLSKLGFIVEKASDGKEGLEKVKKIFPDLIIMDNIMPKMTGWELTKNLKNDEKYRSIPIIMLSALDDVKDKVEGFELGVEDYITKPFNFTEVLARIRAVLRTHELFAQIVARESRLSLAELMNADIKRTLDNFAANIDELDAVISKAGGDPLITEKTKKVKKDIAELEARIEKTLSEWDALKKNEIGLSALEEQKSSLNPQTARQE
ncbi:MAG: response regulator [Treponema sp.]|jgi:DNA-binding response OmpR family regulator|nr:response regulator [Treponema sp.]